jgi:hypothetical protein
MIPIQTQGRLIPPFSEDVVPPPMRDRPRDAHGAPIPWFVADASDLRIASAEKRIRAFRERLCWCCGKGLHRRLAFVGGPACCANRRFGDWASHPACAVFAVRACPFLNGLRQQRSGRPEPEGSSSLPGAVADGGGPVCVYVATGEARLLRDGLFRPPPWAQISWWRDGSRMEPADALPVIHACLVALGAPTEDIDTFRLI